MELDRTHDVAFDIANLRKVRFGKSEEDVVYHIIDRSEVRSFEQVGVLCVEPPDDCITGGSLPKVVVVKRLGVQRNAYRVLSECSDFGKKNGREKRMANPDIDSREVNQSTQVKTLIPLRSQHSSRVVSR